MKKNDNVKFKSKVINSRNAVHLQSSEEIGKSDPFSRGTTGCRGSDGDEFNFNFSPTFH